MEKITSHSFQKKDMKSIELFGISVKHTLLEDQVSNMTNELIKELKEQVVSSELIYLVQIYDEEYEKTGRIHTFVGVRNNLIQSKSQLEKLILPEGSYYALKFLTSLAEIDEVYQACYLYFEESQTVLSGNFDFEVVNPILEETELYFPVRTKNLFI